ncbi:MAG: hypothetical protein GF334_09580 [Candidatus Altiarchaeales archaeon]|nr:hypothetical protein [Candidatus Altiarchaeales archaeon]
MSSYRYKKGAGFERDLVDLFWRHGWAALRSAGSGSVKHPVPDVVAVRDGCIIAVECKTTGKTFLSLKKAVEALRRYELVSCAQAYLAVKFDRCKPRFYPLTLFNDLKGYTVKKSTGYLDFEMILGRQERL